jgi:nitrogenase molybdenum-iron protein alpha/beta subunit
MRDIDGLIPILHGPKGCGYHYRLARRRYLPVYRMECTDLTEQDIIYGGEEKLRQTILGAAARYTPDIILVLPTTVTDLIGSHIQGVVEELRSDVNCKIVAVTSEVFSNRDRSALRQLIQDNVTACHAPKAKPSYDLLGCGFMEVMCALVEQAMEPQEMLPNTVNIENFAWGYGTQTHMHEIGMLLLKLGVAVNAYLPGCSAQAVIHEAARAQLNIVRCGRRWGKLMVARFGTAYLFLQNLYMYHGLTGTARFLREVAEQLHLPETVRGVIKQEKASAEEQMQPYREYFRHFDFALVTQIYLYAPYLISLFEREYGMPLKVVCVEMHEERLRTAGVSPETAAAMRENLREALRQSGSQAELIVNAGDDAIREAGRKVDYVVGTPKVTQYGSGVKVLEYPGQFTRIGFQSFVQIAKYLKARMQAEQGTRKPLLTKLSYDEAWYPMLNQPAMHASHEMWRTMWALREKGK